MNDIYETVEYLGYTIKIYPEDCNESPRDWDNLGTMLCFHNRYPLGDAHKDMEELNTFRYLTLKEDKKEIDIAIEEKLLDYDDIYDNNEEDEHHLDPIEISKLILKHPDYISLPLYLYDHSGITMNTTGFSCPWDSGQVGIIFVSKNKIAEEYKNHGGLTEENIEKAKKVLLQEVETYDQYLRGEIYGYTTNSSKEKNIDSCWGFYGTNWEGNGLFDHSKGFIDADILEKEEYAKNEKEQLEHWKNKGVVTNAKR